MNTSSTLRITTRGRVVLGSMVAIPILAVSLFVASSAASAESAVSGNSYEYVTVLSGDTLWSIADMVAPDRDPRDVVQEIMKLNGISSAQLMPGQELALPR